MARLRAVILMAAAALSVSFSGTNAQQYPSKPIKLIVPAAPGGPNDVLARLLAQHFQTALGATVVIDNRGGAGGMLGARMVAAADPDGYTLLVGNTANLANLPAFSKTVGYDPITSFEPIAKITDSIQILVVKSDFPVKTVQELVGLAKKDVGKLSYSSAGAGNLTHLSGELFKLRAGIDLVHVPYKSTGEAATAILGGQVQFTFGGISSLLPLIRDGQLRALAITGTARVADLPDVPTMIESGFPGFVVTSFFGIVAPAKTPAAILDQLNASINGGLNSADMKGKFANLGMEPTVGSRQDFMAFIATELKKWTELAKSSGITSD